MNVPLKVLYEDAEIFCVAKPTGIHSVSIGERGGQSMADLLLKWTPSLAQASPSSGDAGLVNRLDFETTGILVGAKNLSVWETLRAAWASGAVIKEYLCLVEGEAPERTLIEGYIGAKGRSSKKVHMWATEKPRSVYTRSELKKVAFDEDTKISLVRVTTSTGARHQVRVHAASTGHPLVGDAPYGSKLVAPHFYLHAGVIRFPHPTTGVMVIVEVPPEWRSEDKLISGAIDRLSISHNKI